MSEPSMSVAAYFRRYSTYIKIFLIFLSVAVPLVVLYSLNAASFDKAFNGRAYYLFFVWLVVLEFALDWDTYKSEATKMSFKRALAFGLALLLPTVYVVVSNFFGFNTAIINVFSSYGVITPWLDNAPLAMEYIAFAMFYILIFLFAYKLKGLLDFSLSVSLLGIIGAIFTINILFPYGGFTPFQFLVPITTQTSASVFNFMGYQTAVMPNTKTQMPVLIIRDPASGLSWSGQIAWPCAGIESLLLYTIIMLLFLKKSDIPRLQKVGYFAFGALVTYGINILRIITIFLIGLNNGDVWAFHDYYAQLYSATWIVMYPLIIIGSRIIWSKYKNAIVGFMVND